MKLNFDQIKAYFKEIFSKVAPEVNFDSIKIDQPLRDQVEIDSLDLYNILVALQKKTGVYIPDTKMAELTTLHELINEILSQGELNGSKS